VVEAETCPLAGDLLAQSLPSSSSGFVIFKGQEGRIVEASDRSGVAIVALHAPLGKPAPLIRVTARDWDLLELVDD
jgi:hypothetical protein